jgi:hypothetical protein
MDVDALRARERMVDVSAMDVDALRARERMFDAFYGNLCPAGK